jgi:hypothetical protein
MKIFLGRTTTVKKADKEQVMERLRTFEQLFEQDEFVRRQRALGKTEGKIDGKAEALLSIVKVRFPALYLFAETRVAHSKNMDALDDVIHFCISSSDEMAARAFIDAKLPE